MRRWIIIFLVLINIVFFYWQYQQSQIEVVQPQVMLQVPEGTPGLVLLSEAQVAPATRSPRKPVLDAEAELSSDALIARFKAGQSLNVDAPIEEELESKKQKLDDSAVEEMLACWQIGPFTDEVTSKQVAYRLQQAQTPATSFQKKTARPSLWWVYLPPLESRNQALQLLRSLQSKKIDSFLVTKGENKHAISLGFFSKAETAQEQLRLHKEKGYQAKVVEKPRFTMATWFVVKPNVSSGNWLKLEQSLYEIAPKLKKLKKSCKSVALSDSFN